MSKTKIGIIGGMGPQAGVEFCRLLVGEAVKKGACRNADFPEFILYSLAPEDVIAADGELAERALKEELQKAGRVLCLAEVEVVVLTCNTAHLYASSLKRMFGRRFLPLPELVAKKVGSMSVRKAGLLASPQTIKQQVYNSLLATHGVGIIVPSEEEIAVLEKVIRQVIAGRLDSSVVARVKGIHKQLQKRGAEQVILGCTELSLIPELKKGPRTVDSLTVLARAVTDVVDNALYLPKGEPK